MQGAVLCAVTCSKLPVGFPAATEKQAGSHGSALKG